MTPTIIMYGRADGTCSGCEQAKALLSEYDISYDFRDIGTSDVVKRIDYKKELRAYGVAHIPFLIINGEKIIGFDETILRKTIDSIL